MIFAALRVIFRSLRIILGNKLSKSCVLNSNEAIRRKTTHFNLSPQELKLVHNQVMLWSRLVHQRVASKAIMMYSIVNNTAPEYLTSRFVRGCDLTSSNLRENEYKLAVPQPRTEFYKKKSHLYSGSVL